MSTVTDWKYPSANGTAQNQWLDAGNMYASDNSRCHAENNQSHGFTGFGFDGSGGVPEDQVITGIEFRVEGKVDLLSSEVEISGKIIKGGAAPGTIHAVSTHYTLTTDRTYNYGGDTYMMGVTLESADVRAPDFGILLLCVAIVDGSVFQGDHVAMRLWYEPAPSSEGRVTAIDAGVTHTLKTARITALAAGILFTVPTALLTALDAGCTYTTVYEPEPVPPVEATEVFPFTTDYTKDLEWAHNGDESDTHHSCISDDPYICDNKRIYPDYLADPPHAKPLDIWFTVTPPADCETITKLKLVVNKTEYEYDWVRFHIYADDELVISIGDNLLEGNPGGVTIGGAYPNIYWWNITGLDIPGTATLQIRVEHSRVTYPEQVKICAMRIFGTYEVGVEPVESTRVLSSYVVPSAVQSFVAPSRVRSIVPPSVIKGKT